MIFSHLDFWQLTWLTFDLAIVGFAWSLVPILFVSIVLAMCSGFRR